MDEFVEALERLDVTLEDFSDMGTLVDRLDSVLGRAASALQIDIAATQFRREFGTLQQLALATGGGIDRFVRGGRTVVQLRDRFGRFVTSGVANVSRRLRQGSG